MPTTSAHDKRGAASAAPLECRCLVRLAGYRRADHIDLESPAPALCRQLCSRRRPPQRLVTGYARGCRRRNDHAPVRARRACAATDGEEVLARVRAHRRRALVVAARRAVRLHQRQVADAGVTLDALRAVGTLLALSARCAALSGPTLRACGSVDSLRALRTHRGRRRRCRP